MDVKPVIPKKSPRWCVHRKVALIVPMVSSVVVAVLAAVIFLHSEDTRMRSAKTSDADVTDSISRIALALTDEATVALDVILSQNNFTQKMANMEKFRVMQVETDNVIQVLVGNHRIQSRDEDKDLSAILTNIYSIRSDVEKFSLSGPKVLAGYWRLTDKVLTQLSISAATLLSSRGGLLCAAALSGSVINIANEAAAFSRLPYATTTSSENTVAMLLQTNTLVTMSAQNFCGGKTMDSLAKLSESASVTNAVYDLGRTQPFTTFGIPPAEVAELNATIPNRTIARQVFTRNLQKYYDRHTDAMYLVNDVGVILGCSLVIAVAICGVVLQGVNLWKHSAVHTKEINVENEITKLVESTDRIQQLLTHTEALEGIDKSQFRARTSIEKALVTMVHPFEEHRKYLHPMLLNSDAEHREELLSETGLKAQKFTILFISLQHLHNRVSTESASQKQMANSVQKFLSYITDICVTQNKGYLHRLSPNVLTIVWGLDSEGMNEDHTLVACESAMQMAKATDFTIRCAVCTSDYLVGVVGNDITKSIVIMGLSTSLGYMMTKIAAIHEVQIALDQRTLQALDIQKYKGRGLERVGIHGYRTIVYELAVAQQERDTKQTSWNDAFAAYIEGNKAKTVEIVEALNARNVTSPSLRRLFTLMKQEPPCFLTVKPNATTILVEEDLL